MSAQLQEPAVARSGASIHSRDEEEEFAKQQDDNPLEVRSNSSIQATPSLMERENPMSSMHIPASPMDHPDEPPPPYEPINTGPPINTNVDAIEFSEDNSPQLVFHDQADYIGSSAQASRSPDRGVTSFQSAGLPSISPSEASLVPAPLTFRPASAVSSFSQQSVPTAQSPASSAPPTFSSAKAREAGFEIDQTPILAASPSQSSVGPVSPVSRSDSNSSLPSVTILPTADRLNYTRQAGKAIAYAIPFPKPRLKGFNPEEIPDRFFIYTPPLPPLSKPAEGEKEGAWHKTQRQWQEDVRRATMTHASAASWKGMKARTTVLFGKGVTMSRSCNVEFLDRVSGGAVTASEAAEHADKTSQDASEQHKTISELPSPVDENTHARTSSVAPSVSPSVSQSVNSKTSANDDKPRALEDLTLIYPPSLVLSPEQIRAEFMETLARTKSQSRKDAVIASTLVPFAATIDASLIFTFGGLTQMSGAWAYNSTRGAFASKRMAEGLAMADDLHYHKGETQGCTCGHHENTFGFVETLTKTQQKAKKKAITLQLQMSPQIELLRRYLDLACLKSEFNMYPHISEAAGDPNESAILEALGWRPVRRQGADLELEFKGKVEKLTPEQDEEYQWREAREDIKRMFRKAAKEWATMCSSGFEDKEKKKEKAKEKKEKDKEKKKSEWDA